MIINRNRIFSLLIFLIFSSGCYESKVSCLDILAANYTPSSDEACDNCCVFPTIQLKLEHTFKGKKLIFGVDTLSNSISFFKLIDQKFYLSGIQVFDDNTNIPFYKSSNYTIDGIQQTWVDDIAIIEKAVPTFAFNTIRTTAVPDSMKIDWGVDPRYNKIEIKNLTSSSPLSSTKKMYNDTIGAYIHYYLHFIGGESLKDTMTIRLYNKNSFHIPLKGIQVIKGQTISLPITIDYDVLFGNIDFRKDQQTISDLLAKNIEKGIIK